MGVALSACVENVPVARRVVDVFAATLSITEETFGDIRLAVTEAFTNVVRHAYSGDDGLAHIEIAVYPDSVEICVSDQGRGMQTDRASGPGHGLHLIRTVSDRCEFHAGVGGGNVLRMSFATRHELGVAPHTGRGERGT